MTRKYSNKAKIGRGFTLAELKQAGLSGAFAQTVGIAVDHRRHNKNAETMAMNVKRLTDYKTKLVLFPAKDGKFKKGMIPDSTADKVYQKLRAERINARYEGARKERAKKEAEKKKA